MERQAKQQNQDQQGQPQKEGQGKDQNQGQQQQDGQNGQSGEQKSGDQKSGEQKSGDQKSGDQKSGQDQAQSQTGSGTQPMGDQGASQTADTNSKPPQGNTGSDTRQLPQTASGTMAEEDPNKERKDVAMGEQKPDQPPPPDASQKARALKNQKINPYLVEKLLRDMEEREKEVQRNYRRDPQRKGEMDELDDPFFMSHDQLRDFFERRSGRKPRPETQTTPDW
jgi:hypothetical protein